MNIKKFVFFLFIILFISQLFAYGEGWLGIEYKKVDNELYRQLKLEGWRKVEKYLYTYGIQVTCVYKDSPADKAGIRPGHVITRIARAHKFTFNSPHQPNAKYYMDKYIRKGVGKEVPISFCWMEDGKKKGKTVKVKIVHRPSSYIDCRAYDLDIQGDELKKKGELTEAYNKYLHASNHSMSSENRLRIRTKCIKTYRLLGKTTEIPKNAKNEAYIAGELVKESKDNNDLNNILGKYWVASGCAPWWSDPYFNMGLICEKLKSYNWAIIYYKLYLEADPSAEDKDAVEKKIYLLEYKIKEGK